MTTDLTRGTAEAFPFNDGGWAFDEAEMRELFPKVVVDHLVASTAPPDSPDRGVALAAAHLVALPAADDLPILLGARLSLSFPVLLSAIPLYAWVPQLIGDQFQMRYVKCWLSDGGITSNLPV